MDTSWELGTSNLLAFGLIVTRQFRNVALFAIASAYSPVLLSCKTRGLSHTWSSQAMNLSKKAQVGPGQPRVSL
jgi:hypothetical protein